MKTIRVKPGKTEKGDTIPVHVPETGQLIPPGGLTVPATSYYLRRLRAGDLVEVTSRPKKAAAEKGA